jgi:hypothetical protein
MLTSGNSLPIIDFIGAIRVIAVLVAQASNFEVTPMLSLKTFTF